MKKVGEKIGNPQTLNDGSEVSDDKTAQTNKPAAGAASKPANKGYGYTAPQEKSDIVTHPIASLTPYQNKYKSLLKN